MVEKCSRVFFGIIIVPTMKGQLNLRRIFLPEKPWVYGTFNKIARSHRSPFSVYRSAFERSGSTEHMTPMSGSVNEKGERCERATLLKVP